MNGYLKNGSPRCCSGRLAGLVNMRGFRGYEDRGEWMTSAFETLFKKNKKPPSLEGG